MFVNWYTDSNKVTTSSFIAGNVFSDLSGLNNRKVLKTETLSMLGRYASRLPQTTTKSSQFQVSLK